VLGELQKLKDESRVDKAEYSQPLCTAVQIAVVNLLRRWNINPVSVIGHSSGEIAAAYACGALTMEEAIVVAYLRGLAFTKQPIRPGGMAAIGLGREAVTPFLCGDAVIACENSPHSVTLAGDVDGINKVMARIKDDSPDVFARRLKVEMAFHSPHMKEAGQTFARMLGSKVSSRAPAIPMFSSQTNNSIRNKGALNGPYWQSSYDNPVLFNTVMQKLILSRSASAAPLVLVEIGPHSALAGPIRQIIKECQKDVSYVPTLVRGEDATHNLLTVAGKLFLRGTKLDFQAVNRGGRVLADLPSYSWNHSTRYWDEGRLSKQWRLREFAHHDLLGSRIADSGDLQPAWRNLLRLVDIPWCRDHVIAGDIVFPGAGYIAMAVEAMRQIDGGAHDEGFTLRSVSLLAALTMNETTATETVLSMRPLRLTDSLDDSSWYEFSIMSYNTSAGSWTKHCTGQARQGKDHEVESMHIADLPRKVQSSSWYRVLKKAGMNYGPAFQGLERLSAHPVTNSAVSHISNVSGPADSVYQIHPSTLDTCIQLFTTAACKGQARSFSTVPFVPTWIGEAYVKRPHSEIVVRADATFGQKGAIDGTCLGFAGDDPAVILRDVKMSPLGDASSSRGDDPHAAVTLSWMPDLSLTTIDRLGDDRVSQDPQQWLRLLGHKKPDMNILSLGSLAQETTPAHLDALTSEFGERMFSSFTIIEDTRTANDERTTTNYRDVPGVVVRALDTNQDVVDWQMEHASADLIILSEVSFLFHIVFRLLMLVPSGL
jgi:acyl transferase domain-containing protein